MVTLAIDTATTAVVVGIVMDGEVRSQRIAEGDAHGAQCVLASVATVLEDAALRLGDVNRIVVGVGPGSFTGLRIGIATALGLGDGGGIPVHPADTLRALELGAGGEATAVIDARRGEVFAAGGGVPAASYDPGVLASLVPDEAVLVGDGACRYRDLLPSQRVPVDGDDRHRPSVLALTEAARPDAPVVPRYLREPDAVSSGGRV